MSQAISSATNATVKRRALLGVMLCCTSSSVFASGFSLLEQSASRLGTAFSGAAAAADDATTIFYNPAGMAKLSESQLLVFASGVLISSEFNSRSTQPALGQPLGNEDGDAGSWNAIPSAYIAVPLNDKFAVGLGVNAPFGLKLEYDDGWMGRFQALNSEITTYNFNPSLSWRVSEQLSLGVGVDYQRIQAELTNAACRTKIALGSP